MAESSHEACIGWGKNYLNIFIITPDDKNVLLMATSDNLRRNEILNKSALMQAARAHMRALSGGEEGWHEERRTVSDGKTLTTQINRTDPKREGEAQRVQICSVLKGLTYVTYENGKKAVTIPLCLAEHAYRTMEAISRTGNEVSKIKLLHPTEVKSWAVSKPVVDKWKEWHKEIDEASRCDTSNDSERGQEDGGGDEEEDEEDENESVPDEERDDDDDDDDDEEEEEEEEEKTEEKNNKIKNADGDDCDDNNHDDDDDDDDDDDSQDADFDDRDDGETMSPEEQRRQFEELCELRKAKLKRHKYQASSKHAWKRKNSSDYSTEQPGNKIPYPHTKGKDEHGNPSRDRRPSRPLAPRGRKEKTHRPSSRTALDATPRGRRTEATFSGRNTHYDDRDKYNNLLKREHLALPKPRSSSRHKR